MKKLLLTIALIFTSLLCKSQNIPFLLQANKCDLNFARTFSDEIVSLAKEKYVYYDSAESQYLSDHVLVYVKEGLTDSERKSTEAYFLRYKTGNAHYQYEDNNCLAITFKINYVGANKDLEIKGVKEYSFDSVKGKFLDLFSFYQKNVQPTATTENTTTTGNYSVRKDADGYWYNFFKTNVDGLWHLRNMSLRLKPN